MVRVSDEDAVIYPLLLVNIDILPDLLVSVSVDEAVMNDDKSGGVLVNTPVTLLNAKEPPPDAEALIADKSVYKIPAVSLPGCHSLAEALYLITLPLDNPVRFTSPSAASVTLAPCNVETRLPYVMCFVVDSEVSTISSLSMDSGVASTGSSLIFASAIYSPYFFLPILYLGTNSQEDLSL